MKAESFRTTPELTIAHPQKVLSSRQWAKVISDIGSPPVLGLLMFLIVGQYIGTASGWLWIAGFIVTMIALPVIYIYWMVWNGKATDFHLPRRKERIQPLCFAIWVTIVATMTAWRLGASGLILLVGYLNIVQTVVVLVITLFWKVSVHCVAAAMLCTLSFYLYGPVALLTIPIVPIIAWSRLALRRHTRNQVICGALLGVSIVWLVVQYTS